MEEITQAPDGITKVDAPFNATHGAPTPFSRRWGGAVFCLLLPPLQNPGKEVEHDG